MAKVEWTVQEAARAWGVKTSMVHKYVAQGRVPYRKVGGGSGRAGLVLILDDQKPAPRRLTEFERDAWPRSRSRSRKRRR